MELYHTILLMFSKSLNKLKFDLQLVILNTLLLTLLKCNFQVARFRTVRALTA